jgi:predicted Zn-dependent protease
MVGLTGHFVNPWVERTWADEPTPDPTVGAFDDEDDTVAPRPRSNRDFDLGLRITMQALAEIGYVDDDSIAERVNDIGYRVASVVPEPGLFTFHVIDLPYPNAFALPGGFVFVTRGMLETDLSDAELAALLGHEIGHVLRDHFSRSQRLSSILSLAQLAMFVGVLLAADEMEGSAPRYERQGDMVYQGSSGGDALVQGVPAFGGLFRTLVERKYGRGLEFEADDTGAKLAALAGYPTRAAESMLRRFRRRIHEETTYGYWLTHPFFDDRIVRASARGRALVSAPESPPTFAYRRHVQRELFRIAANREDEDEAVFLYQLALTAQPHGKTALEAGREILQFRIERNRKRRPIERELWSIVADYDSLISVADRIEPDGELLGLLVSERDSVNAVRLKGESEFLGALDRDVRATSHLRAFVENYPDRERYPEMLFRLAENYYRSGRADEAVGTYLDLWTEHPESVWWDRARPGLSDLVNKMEQPVMVERLLRAQVQDTLTVLAGARMDSLVVSVESMQDAAVFLDRFPSSEYAPAMRLQLEAKAEEAYREARILEGVARQQRALDSYHRILFLAPESPAADLSRHRIDALVRSG